MAVFDSIEQALLQINPKMMGKRQFLVKLTFVYKLCTRLCTFPRPWGMAES
jgi:hypothetical protein